MVHCRLVAWAFFPVAALLAMVIVPASGELMAPVFLYLLAIGVMVMGAAVCDRPLSLLFTGACLFALSDSLIGVNKFLFTLPMAGVWVMITYYAAQYLIVRGVTKVSSGKLETELSSGAINRRCYFRSKAGVSYSL